MSRCPGRRDAGGRRLSRQRCRRCGNRRLAIVALAVTTSPSSGKASRQVAVAGLADLNAADYTAGSAIHNATFPILHCRARGMHRACRRRSPWDQISPSAEMWRAGLRRERRLRPARTGGDCQLKWRATRAPRGGGVDGRRLCRHVRPHRDDGFGSSDTDACPAPTPMEMPLSGD